MDWLIPWYSYLEIIDFSYEFINTINFANVKSLEFALDIDSKKYFDDKFISFFDENLNTSQNPKNLDFIKRRRS